MFLRYDFGTFHGGSHFSAINIVESLFSYSFFLLKQDWIKEARLFLETRQACDALLAHAAAFGLEIFPQSSQKEKKCCH